ncbi:hypothetical protein JTB14_020493 [Gonioctena quinquepunctata]|nr:hypothetical protein JTB14_020493 [Gonioctena quinquepunctata]
MIKPYPKAAPRKTKGGRKKGKTRILTDTPEKNAMEMEHLERLARKSKNKVQKETKKVFAESSDDNDTEIPKYICKIIVMKMIMEKIVEESMEIGKERSIENSTILEGEFALVELKCKKTETNILNASDFKQMEVDTYEMKQIKRDDDVFLEIFSREQVKEEPSNIETFSKYEVCNKSHLEQNQDTKLYMFDSTEFEEPSTSHVRGSEEPKPSLTHCWDSFDKEIKPKLDPFHRGEVIIKNETDYQCEYATNISKLKTKAHKTEDEIDIIYQDIKPEIGWETSLQSINEIEPGAGLLNEDGKDSRRQRDNHSKEKTVSYDIEEEETDTILEQMNDEIKNEEDHDETDDPIVDDAEETSFFDISIGIEDDENPTPGPSTRMKRRKLN